MATIIKEYSPHEKFNRQELVDHKKFGVGYISSADNECGKMKVLFPGSQYITLICNREESDLQLIKNEE